MLHETEYLATIQSQSIPQPVTREQTESMEGGMVREREKKEEEGREEEREGREGGRQGGRE